MMKLGGVIAVRILFFCCVSFIFARFLSVESFQQTKSNHHRRTTSMRSSPDSGNGFEVKTWNPLRLLVLRLGFTEPAWTSPLNYQKKSGTYTCAYCGNPLFDTEAKYDSGSGWPSFWRSINEGTLDYKMEFDGRLECRCGTCKSHLGHVFLDGPRPESVPQSLLENSPESDPRSRRENARLPRFCVNGASLRVQTEESSS